VPEGQGAHDGAAGSIDAAPKPGRHTSQSDAAVAPPLASLVVVPRGQAVQGAAPSSALNVPAGQGLMPVEGGPSVVQPAATTHCAALVAPCAASSVGPAPAAVVL
jgi:hypothetical protein